MLSSANFAEELFEVMVIHQKLLSGNDGSHNWVRELIMGLEYLCKYRASNVVFP